MFKKGEKIIYGQTGVCEVLDITEKELIKNQRKLYYVLSPVFQQNNIIYAPIDSDKVFMRSIMSKEEALKLISKIPEIKSKIKSAELSADECRAKILSHDINELVELGAIIYEKKKTAREQKKKLGFADEKFMQIAENLLFGELAVALDIPLEQVLEFIKGQLGE